MVGTVAVVIGRASDALLTRRELSALVTLPDRAGPMSDAPLVLCDAIALATTLVEGTISEALLILREEMALAK